MKEKNDQTAAQEGLAETAQNRAQRLKALAEEYAAKGKDSVSSVDLKREINSKSELFESLRTDLEELQDRYARIVREEEAAAQRELELKQRIRERSVFFVNEKTGERKTLKGQYALDELPKDEMHFNHLLNQHTLGQVQGWLEENDLMSDTQRGLVQMARKHLKEYGSNLRDLRSYLKGKPVATSPADLRKFEHYLLQIQSSIQVIRRAGVEFHPIVRLEEFHFEDVQLPLQARKSGKAKATAEG